ncbi:MAG: 16S rRNA (guanine(527)-N(7))-methyltransferase RsmG [Thermodesulfobacteriota bacterium]
MTGPQSSDLFRQGCAALGLSLETPAIARLDRYLSELRRWNTKMNLVADAPLQEMIDCHFLDSLTLLPHLDPGSHPVLLDVGTGAGFPGLALKCAAPSLALTLVEPREKRVIFLRHIVRQLDLAGVEIVPRRLEKKNTENILYPLITSRAVANVAEFLDLVAAWCPSSGTVICMKGPRADEEIAQWQTTASSSPFFLRNSISLGLPFSGSRRTLLFFTKI